LFLSRAALYTAPCSLNGQAIGENKNLKKGLEPRRSSMSTNPTWEKYQQATIALARAGAIKERLASAYRNHLCTVAEEDLPKEFREEFRAFCRALTRERPVLRGEDSFRATLRKMSCTEAEGLACAVVHMFCALPRGFTAQRSKASSAMAQVVPLFIAEA
jgi:hypothetical protein